MILSLGMAASVFSFCVIFWLYLLQLAVFLQV